MLALIPIWLSLSLAPDPAAHPPTTPAELVAPASPDAIVGGDPVEPGKHPAVVSVSIGLGLCTGTLLTPELVLTAAHCLRQSFLEPSLIRVGLGEDSNAPTQALGVTAFGTHPELCVAASPSATSSSRRR